MFALIGGKCVGLQGSCRTPTEVADSSVMLAEHKNNTQTKKKNPDRHFAQNIAHLALFLPQRMPVTLVTGWGGSQWLLGLQQSINLCCRSFISTACLQRNASVSDDIICHYLTPLLILFCLHPFNPPRMTHSTLAQISYPPTPSPAGGSWLFEASFLQTMLFAALLSSLPGNKKDAVRKHRELLVVSSPPCGGQPMARQ